jgi:two-component system response regulator (stage 0 sporulation protein A)
MQELLSLDEMIKKAEILVKTLKEGCELQSLCARTPIVARSIEKKIADALKCYGVPMHLKGSRYLRDAISIAVWNPDEKNRLTTSLYHTVAKMNNTTIPAAERAMRTAIEVAASRGNIEFADTIFGQTMHPDKHRPTSREFIAAFAEYISLAVVCDYD